MNSLLKFIAMIGLIFLSLPYLGGAGLALCVFFRFWSGISWWWCAIPGALLLFWFVEVTKDD